MSAEWYDVVRVLSITLLVIGLVVIFRRLHRNEDVYTARMVAAVWMVAGWMGVALVSTIESLLQDSPFGWRVLLIALMSVITLKVLSNTGEFLRGEEKRGN